MVFRTAVSGVCHRGGHRIKLCITRLRHCMLVYSVTTRFWLKVMLRRTWVAEWRCPVWPALPSGPIRARVRVVVIDVDRADADTQKCRQCDI